MKSIFEKKSSYTRRLSFQLGLPFLSFLLIVLLALFFSTYFTFQRSKENAKNVPLEKADHISEDLDKVLDSILRTSKFASRNAGDNVGENISLFEDIVKNTPAILELTFFDTNGNEISRVVSPTVGTVTPLGNNILSEKYFAEAIAGDDYLETPFLSQNNILFSYAAFPVRNVRGEIIGILRVTVDMSVLWESLTEFSEGDAYIVDRNGILLLSKNLSETKERMRLDNMPAVSGFLHDEKQVFSYKNNKKESVIATWNGLENAPWAGVIVEISRSVLYKEATNQLGLLITFVILMLALCAYFIYRINQFIFRPLKKLQQGAEKIGEGNFDVTIDVDSRNEFDDLADSFNAMSQKLKEFYRDLEKKVQERTSELNKQILEIEKMNQYMVYRELRMIELKKKIKKLEKQCGIESTEGEEGETNKESLPSKVDS